MEIQDIKFVALDGEGITVNQIHHYNLLVFRNHQDNLQYELYPRKNEMSLRTEDILYRIGNLRRVGGYVYVMFYFNYDVTMWLKDWPIELRTNLWQHGTVNWTNSKGIPYRISYIPHKLFAIHTPDIHGVWRHVTIYDAFGFFQTSFVKALDNWGVASLETLQQIEAMKKARGEFASYDRRAVVKYCAQECEYLCILMERLRDAMLSENIPIQAWYGSGAVGQALMQREKMHEIVQPLNYMSRIELDPQFDEAVMSAYFGGRFELCRQGIVGRTYQYDINSAYPYAMTTIPDFSNVEIEIAEEYNPHAKFALWFVTYDIRNQKGTPLFGPLPFRTKTGSIVFPYYNSNGVWCHACELHMAQKLYGAHCFTIHCGYILHPKSDRVYPFSFIHEMAERRLHLKSRGDKRNIVLKLALNSLYGKMAQGIGAKGKLPRFQNYYLAGYVTAHCRAQILELGWSCGNKGSDVIQFATDGVFSTSPSRKLGTISSSQLGEWEFKKLDNPVCYLQAGIYFSKKKRGESENESARRTRGFRANRLSAATIFDAWNTIGPGAEIDAADSRFVGIGSCIVRGKWDDYGQWKKVPHNISILPPTGKQYLIESGYHIFGVESGAGEVTTEMEDYIYVVPWNESPKLQTVSIPYPHKRQQDIGLRFASLDDSIIELIKKEIEDFDQPNYERWRGFGDMQPGDV